jgi:hypothetical protein
MGVVFTLVSVYLVNQREQIARWLSQSNAPTIEVQPSLPESNRVVLEPLQAIASDQGLDRILIEKENVE